MRTRSLKPGFFHNEELGQLSPLTRLLFAGLWLIADREGRLEDRPARIKAQLLPYDECGAAATHKMLQDLHDAGFILRYEVGRSKYIELPSFQKHQNPHTKEAASTIPAPEKPSASPVQVSEIPEPTVPTTSFLSLDSLSLDSLSSSFPSSQPASTNGNEQIRPIEDPPSLEPGDAGVPDLDDLPVVVHHPETKRAVVSKFPDTDDAFLRHLVKKCQLEAVAANKPPELVTDDVIAAAVIQSTKRGQRTAGLYLTTVPQCIKNWATTEA